MKKIVAACASMTLLVALTGPFISPVWADTDLQKQQDAILKQIQETKSLLTQTKQEEKKAMLELKALSSSISKTENELNNIEKSLQKTANELAVLKKDLQETNERQEQQTAYMGNRLKEMYIQGDISYLEVLLDSTSITDFLTRWDLLNKLAENDAAIIDQLNASIEEIRQKTEATADAQAKLLALQEDRNNKRRGLEIDSSRKQQLLKDIQAEKASYEQMEKELLAESERIAEEIRRLLPKDNSQYMGSGKLYWPTPGYTRITSKFGPRIHPIHRTKSNHTGVDIGAANKTDIHAAETGEVIAARWNNAYGNMVIISHGGNITTMYAHMSSIGVKVGQKVAKGDVIGKVGSTGWSTGPHLHFEVRVNGNPVNPMTYLQ